MNEAPPPPPPPASPAPPVPPAAPPAKSRTWFVVLAWVTLVLFGLFVAGITAVTASIPRIKKSGEGWR